MAEADGRDRGTLAQALLLDDPGFLREIVERTLQAILEEELTAHLGAGRHERGAGRTGDRNGARPRTPTTRVGALELRVPQDRDGAFSTERFARHQRSERALVTTPMEVSAQGVATRTAAAITEERCGTTVSKSQVSALVGRLDPGVAARRSRPLAGAAHPSLVVEARYEPARVDGRVVGLGVLVVAGVRGDGRREVLAVAAADTEREATDHGLLTRLTERGWRGVELVTGDDHRGLEAAIDRHVHGASWPRGRVHFGRDLRGVAGAKHRGRLGEDLRGVSGAGTAAPAAPPGRPAAPRWRPSSRRTWRTASRATPSRPRTGPASGPRLGGNGSPKNSNGGRGWCASFPTGRACSAWPRRWPWSSARSGSADAGIPAWTRSGRSIGDRSRRRRSPPRRTNGGLMLGGH